MRLIPILLIAATACLHAGDSGIAVESHASRTAVYPGDRMEYVVSVEHPASIEFIPDHLKKDQMSFEGFEIVDIAATTLPLSGARKLFQVKFLLRTFEVAGTTLTIPAFDLFYFRHGPSDDKANARAETVSVPPFTVALRSTIVDPKGSLRDWKPLDAASTAEWLAPGAVGLCGLLAVAVWLVWILAAQLRSGLWRRRGEQAVHKKSWAECLDEIRACDADSSEEVEKFYRKASDLLRGIAAGRLGEGADLTPREMQPALGVLLEECERIRYSPDGLAQGRTQRSALLRQLQQIVEER